jgi:hypothetical protein
VGSSDGRPRVTPEGNVDPRAPKVPGWPPGLGRDWPEIALHWQDRKDDVLP